MGLQETSIEMNNLIPSRDIDSLVQLGEGLGSLGAGTGRVVAICGG